MSSTAIQARAVPVGADLSLPLFAATLFLSASLLFSVQPMFARMVLPTLGGAAAVWSVAMVFFQALLFAGYLYAHALQRLPIKAGAALHLALMASAFLALPVALAPGWGAPPADGQAVWMLGLFALSAGLPFFAVAGNGPLLQAWFTRSGHAQARDPYFLYVASNIGSFVALIAYPFAIEPMLALKDQSRWWTLGFVALAGMIGACAVAVARAGDKAPDFARLEGIVAMPVTWRRRLSWLALSFVPSGLLVAGTAHISTDIAAVPLLWVAPLALFLLTFVLTFRERPVPGLPAFHILQVWGTGLGFLGLVMTGPLPFDLTVHLGLVFVNAVVCHAALYRLRPPADRLTEFYVWISLGGVGGGIFCGLLAPHLFSTVLEYPILLVAALFCRPGFFSEERVRWLKAAARALAVTGGAALCAYGAAAAMLIAIEQARLFLILFCVAGLMLVWRRPPLVAAFAAALLFAAPIAGDAERDTFRSFYGVHKLSRTGDGRFLTLSHSTTVHGAIRLKNDDGTPAVGRPEPTTYYTYEGAMGVAIAALRDMRGSLPSLAVVGLGAGSLACHVRSGEAVTFFEIDPLVVRLATDPGRFRFLRDCAPQAAVVLGDARLMLGPHPGRHDAIVIDAFASDSIPTHLVTREALGLYLSKLTPEGALVIHISNRHLDLTRILARTAAEHGLVTFLRAEETVEPAEKRYRSATVVVALARDPAHLGRIASEWRRIEPDRSLAPWTDDYSNIVAAILDRWR